MSHSRVTVQSVIGIVFVLFKKKSTLRANKLVITSNIEKDLCKDLQGAICERDQWEIICCGEQVTKGPS